MPDNLYLIKYNDKFLCLPEKDIKKYNLVHSGHECIHIDDFLKSMKPVLKSSKTRDKIINNILEAERKIDNFSDFLHLGKLILLNKDYNILMINDDLKNNIDVSNLADYMFLYDFESRSGYVQGILPVKTADKLIKELDNSNNYEYYTIPVNKFYGFRGTRYPDIINESTRKKFQIGTDKYEYQQHKEPKFLEKSVLLDLLLNNYGYVHENADDLVVIYIRDLKHSNKFYEKIYNILKKYQT